LNDATNSDAKARETDPTPGLVRRSWPALLLLVAGLTATAVATRHTQLEKVAEERREFNFACREIFLKVQDRLGKHEQILRSGAALFAATEEVSRAEWRTFVQGLQVEDHSPGIQGVGYAQLVPAERLAQHQQEIRQQGFPNYRVWPEGERAVYTAITYLEPFTNRNLRAFGYDMFSEATRRAAMERAWDGNTAALSGKVKLVQETTTDVQAGTLLFVPVYRHDRPIRTTNERRAALQGWVYSPYRMNDLMKGVLGEWDSPTGQRIRLQTYDGAEPAPESLLHDTLAKAGTILRPNGGYTRQTPITYAGHRWTLLFSQSLLAPTLWEHSNVRIVAVAGTVLSLLVAGLLHTLQNTRFNARRLAGRLTADLQQTTDRLGLAAAAGGVGIWDYEIATGKLIWDEQMFRLYGITRTQFSGTYDAWVTGVHPEDRQRADDEVQRAVRGEKEFDTEFRVLWPDGTIRQLQAQSRVQRNAAGQSAHVIGTNWDITERKLAEDKLRQLSYMVEQSTTSVLMTDLRGNIEYINAHFTVLTGYTQEELLGQNPRLLKTGLTSPATYLELWRTITAGLPWHGELQNRKKNGELYWESLSISPLRDAAGSVTHYVALTEDITLRKAAEEELRRAKEAAAAASLAKSLFLANMSHEIRTPMNAIIGFTQLLLNAPSLSSAQRQHLETIGRSGDHLLNLLNDILEMSKIEAGHVELTSANFDLGLLLDDLERIFRNRTEAKRISFKIERAPALPGFLVGDEHKLRQVFTNLLNNAVKFTQRGGVVCRVEVSAPTTSGLLLTGEVLDTGAGMTEEEINTLFQSFHQTASGRKSGSGTGLGLGLALSRNLARLMGGDITVRRREGGGSAFRFQAQLQAGHVAEPAPRLQTSQVLGLHPDQPPPRVLIVDDEDDNRTLLSLMLRGTGFDVCEAGAGAIGLALTDSWRPQLILMDIRMPELDGYETIRRIRSAPAAPPVKIIAVTAGAFEDDRQAALRAGADSFLAKPVRQAELLALIQSLLRLEYLYEKPAAEPPAGPVVPTAEALAGLPEAWRTQVLAALETADFDQVAELIAQLPRHDSELARQLAGLAEHFDATALLKLIRPAPNESI
jgi:PAS domain S-box-containing protein